MPTGAAEHTVTYQTTFTGSIEALQAGVQAANAVGFYAGAGPAPGLLVTRSAQVDIGEGVMNKTGAYNAATHTITWSVKLLLPGKGLSDLVLTDTISQTPVRQSYVAGTLLLTSEGGSTQTLAPDSVEADGSGFVVTLPASCNNAAQYYTLSYQTKLAVADANDQNELWAVNLSSAAKAKNGIQLHATGLYHSGVTVQGEADVTSTVLEKDFVSYNPLTHKATWCLKVNANQMTLTAPVVEDTLPTGWAFDTGAGVTVTWANGMAVSGYTPSPSYSAGNTSFTLALPNTAVNSQPYKITCTAELTDLTLLLRNTPLQVVNTASLTANQVPGTVQVTETQNIGTSVLAKTSDSTTFLTDHCLTWVVEVNRNLAQVVGTSGAPVGIEDILPEGLSYQNGSLTVTKLDIQADDTENLPGNLTLTQGTDYTVQYAAATRKLTVTFVTGANVPNAALLTNAYRIQFKTLVLVSGSYANSLSFSQVANSGALRAQSALRNARFSGGSTRTGNLGVVTLQKQAPTGTALPGASFSITNAATGVLLGTFVTDANGRLIANLPAGTYVFREMQAPAGYEISDSGTYTVVVRAGGSQAFTVKNALLTVTPPSPPSGGVGGDSGGGENGGTGGAVARSVPRTGAMHASGLWVTLGTSALCLVLLMLRKRRA